MIINHNMPSINANNVLKFKTVDVTRSAQKLASGLRINRAADDASGLAVSEKMRSQIRGLNQAERNIQDGVAMIQAAEGYLQQTTDVVQRIRELAIQASNGTYSSEDRLYIQIEVSQLVDEVNRIASHAQFNGRNLLDGTFTIQDGDEEGGLMLHVGANMDQRRSMSIGSMTAADLKIAEVKISNVADSNATIGSVDEALRIINKQRADLGAYQNRFEIAQRGVNNAAENLQYAESLIRDTNMASEMVNFVRDNILTQAGTAMLAQANVIPQTVLRLLG